MDRIVSRPLDEEGHKTWDRVYGKPETFAEAHKRFCKFDTDGDGNCPLHPNGCEKGNDKA